MSASYSRYLVSSSSSGGKFWEVEVVGSTMKTRYGKLGSTPKWSSKTLASPEKARSEAEKKARAKTAKGYADSRRPRPIVSGYADRDLAGLPLAGVLYFRADERYPGGNADMFTIRINLLALPGQPPALTATSHNNWDGEHWTYPETPVKLDLSATLPQLRAALSAALAAGDVDTTATVRDNRSDEEEYDTEWSSIELELTVLPEGATDLSRLDEGDLILRFVQKAVYFSSGDPPTGAALALRDAVKALCGITRVEKNSENEDAFSRAWSPSGTSLGYRSQKVPLYL